MARLTYVQSNPVGDGGILETIPCGAAIASLV
jgi:hypothetical protein